MRKSKSKRTGRGAAKARASAKAALKTLGRVPPSKLPPGNGNGNGNANANAAIGHSGWPAIRRSGGFTVPHPPRARVSEYSVVRENLCF